MAPAEPARDRHAAAGAAAGARLTPTGGTATCTLTLTNNGPSTATAITLTHPLDPRPALTTPAGAGFTCDPTITCTHINGGPGKDTCVAAPGNDPGPTACPDRTR